MRILEAFRLPITKTCKRPPHCYAHYHHHFFYLHSILSTMSSFINSSGEFRQYVLQHVEYNQLRSFRAIIAQSASLGQS